MFDWHDVEKTDEKVPMETKPLYKQINWPRVFILAFLGFLLFLFILAVFVGVGILIINVPSQPAPLVAAPAPTPTESVLATLQPSPTNEEFETSTTITSWNVTTIAGVQKGFAPGWEAEWYWSPFREVTDTLEDDATWETFAEPGVLLDNTAAFDYLSAEETPINVPEGGFAYIAVGHISLSHDGYGLILPGQTNNIYLIIIRGLSDDNTDADLNQQVWASDYPRGFGIYSPMPYGAYVSLGWFLQQVENAQESSGDPNCGADGCDKVTVVVIELQSHSYRMWEITGDSRDWTRVQ
ncbi:MAG: hypothetical protein MUP45_04815 [Candidatus Marinimicrobia bacterium]|nr:hypothetical protein [Candidatus Neomarinimicrobiota bacterium]